MEVLLLTTSHCHFCLDAQEILIRLEAEFDLKVRQIDLSSQEGKLISESMGLPMAPGILIDNELVSYGRPSERKLRRECESRSVR